MSEMLQKNKQNCVQEKMKFKKCECCHKNFYPNELRRVGLSWCCIYCLDMGLVAGVVQNDTFIVENADMTDLSKVKK